MRSQNFKSNSANSANDANINKYNADDSTKKDKYNCYFTDDDYLDMADVCSSSDCTGMVKTGPGYTRELEDYRDMYNFGEPPKTEDKSK